MKPGEDFFNFNNHDIIRAAVAVPSVRVADPFFNAQPVITLMEQAAERQGTVVLFPERSLSAYSCEDLFQQRALLDACGEGLERITNASRAWPIIGVIGMGVIGMPLVEGTISAISAGQRIGRALICSVSAPTTARV